MNLGIFKAAMEFLTAVLKNAGVLGVLVLLLIAQNFYLDHKRAQREERRENAERTERAEVQDKMVKIVEIGAKATAQVAEIGRGYERVLQDNTRVMEQVKWRLARGTGAPPPASGRDGG